MLQSGFSPRGPRGLNLNWPLRWASSMAPRSAGTCSPKRRRRSDRLLSNLCKFFKFSLMALVTMSFSFLAAKTLVWTWSWSSLKVRWNLNLPTLTCLVPPWLCCKRAGTGQPAGPVWRSGVPAVPAQPEFSLYAPLWPAAQLLLCGWCWRDDWLDEDTVVIIIIKLSFCLGLPAKRKIQWRIYLSLRSRILAESWALSFSRSLRFALHLWTVTYPTRIVKPKVQPMSNDCYVSDSFS